MIRSLTIASSIMLLTACGPSRRPETPLNAYQHVDDQMLALAGGWLGRPCMREIEGVWDGPTHVPVPLDQCFRFDAPRHFRGLWRFYVEDSRFCAEPATNCPYLYPRSEKDGFVWLDADATLLPGETIPTAVYEVEFVGRKSSVAGNYVGMVGDVIIVDRMISRKFVSKDQ